MLRKFYVCLTALVGGLISTAAYAAWFLDRDNSMVPAEPEVGRAMAVILSFGPVTQAIQVCHGVYLATGHGVLDNPHTATELHPYYPPGEHPMRLIQYPLARANMAGALNPESYVSPLLRDPNLWKRTGIVDSLWESRINHEYDYVFITLDSPAEQGFEPRDEFVRPLRMTPQELIENRQNLEVYLYRGLPRYAALPNGGISFEEEEAVSREDVHGLIELYQEPQRVISSCQISPERSSYDGYVSHNCPTEPSVSGSSYVVHIQGIPMLVGLNTQGSSLNLESSTGSDPSGSSMLTSSAFCDDYESVCGQPCATFDDDME